MTADCFAEDRRSVTGAPVFGCFMGLAFTLQTLRPKRQLWNRPNDEKERVDDNKKI